MSKINIRKLQEIQDYLQQISPLKIYDIECKSLPQLYYELAKKINEIIKSIDVVETFTIDEIQGLHEIMETLLQDELIPELERIMDDMYESGMLKELVGKILLQDITNRMDEVERISRLAGAEDYYIPATIPSCEYGKNGIPVEVNPNNYEDFLEWKLNKLVNDFPEYVSVTMEGYDQSNVYPIYRYNFTPKNYDRTIVLLGCVHGNEKTPFFGLCEFLDRLCREPQSDNNLVFLREKVQFIVIPIVNPYGFCHNIRHNSRGVDLNRNTSYLWEKYTTSKGQPGKIYYKGEEPFSERETQIVRGVVEAHLQDKLVGSLDLHNIVSIKAEKIVYYPRFSQNISDRIWAVFEQMDTETSEDRRILSTSTVPSMSNWIGHQYKVNAINPEWNNECWDIEGKFSSFNMTKYVEWMVNLTLAIAKDNRPAQSTRAYPFVKTLIWNKNQYDSDTEDTERNSNKGHRILRSTQTPMNPGNWMTSKYRMEVHNEGFVMMDGTITIKAEQDCEVTVCPLLYQQYAPESNFSTMDATDRYWQTVSLLAGQEVIIPLLTSIQVFHSNYNNATSTRASYIEFRIKANTSVPSSAYITDMKVRLHYTPTTMGENLEVLRATGELTQEVIFPTRIDNYDLED